MGMATLWPPLAPPDGSAWRPRSTIWKPSSSAASAANWTRRAWPVAMREVRCNKSSVAIKSAATILAPAEAARSIKNAAERNRPQAVIFFLSRRRCGGICFFAALTAVDFREILMSVCLQCGASLSDQGLFCPRCGTAVSQPGTEQMGATTSSAAGEGLQTGPLPAVAAGGGTSVDALPIPENVAGVVA